MGSLSRRALSLGSTSSDSGMVNVTPGPLMGIRLAIFCASMAGKPIARATSLMTLLALSSWKVAIWPTLSLP